MSAHDSHWHALAAFRRLPPEQQNADFPDAELVRHALDALPSADERWVALRAALERKAGEP